VGDTGVRVGKRAKIIRVCCMIWDWVALGFGVDGITRSYASPLFLIGRGWASLMSFIYMGSHIEFWMEFRNDWFIGNRILEGRSQVKRTGRGRLGSMSRLKDR
jgi:hypothetical protein